MTCEDRCLVQGHQVEGYGRKVATFPAKVLYQRGTMLSAFQTTGRKNWNLRKNGKLRRRVTKEEWAEDVRCVSDWNVCYRSLFCVYGNWNMEVNPVSHGLNQQMGYFLTDYQEVTAQILACQLFIYHIKEESKENSGEKYVFFRSNRLFIHEPWKTQTGWINQK